MAAVAILLSLVLITTSIVSSTLAKYVVSKSVSGKFTFEEFGVTVGMELSDELKAIVDPDYADTPYYDSITLELNSFNLKPPVTCLVRLAVDKHDHRPNLVNATYMRYIITLDSSWITL